MPREITHAFGILSPSTRREWIEISRSLNIYTSAMSPSTRREWIEMRKTLPTRQTARVSLHTEGVD